jgi:hypothetical protein
MKKAEVEYLNGFESVKKLIALVPRKTRRKEWFSESSFDICEQSETSCSVFMLKLDQLVQSSWTYTLVLWHSVVLLECLRGFVNELAE